MSQRFCAFVITLLAYLFGWCETNAVLVTNASSFSLGYGFFAGVVWNTNETATVNTPGFAPNPTGGFFTNGNFRISVNRTGLGLFASQGPTFTNRVLGNYDGANSANGQSSNLTITITATYIGPYPPTNVATPVGFALAIDQISIYGQKHPSVGPPTNEFWWTETTPGHTSTSPSIFLNSLASMTVAANYKQLVWDPAEFLNLGGTNMTRTFRLPNATDGARYGNYGVDGIEIIGSAQLIYDIPEPTSLGLVLFAWCVVRCLVRASRT